ncbi:MAG: NRDE family protein [Bacteroidetes bacterium]|nr:NRDE family protein [Bacteroidota bacterium]MBS1540259.1 NRDE family protein [Bacteroidota bacterium]
MCLIFLSVNQHPRYKLIVAANRDEFYERKTEKASYWKNHPDILGGCDLEAIKPDGTCGTWMAMNKNGRIAMVTNYRDLKNIKPYAPSRGHLVTDYLLSSKPADNYLREIEPHAHEFNGFNLIVGSADDLYYLSNYQTGIDKLQNGMYGLSNALLNTPWPKVQTGKEKMKLLFGESKVDKEKIFDALYDSHQATDDRLPDTGVGIERERMLSSIFIKSPHYGTRCSTIVTVDREEQVTFTERVYDLQTFQFTQQSFQFSVR